MTQEELNAKIDELAETKIVVRTLRDHSGYDPDNWPPHLRKDLFARLGIVRVTKHYETS